MKTSLNNKLRTISFFTLLFSLTAGARLPVDTSRIVAIDGPITEMVSALGLTDHIVATDTSSTVPEAVQALPKVGYVRSIAAEGVLSASPTLIITSDSLAPPAALDQLRSSGVPLIVVPTPSSPEGIATALKHLGYELHLEKQAAALIQELKAAIRKAAEAKPATAPRVAFFMGVSGGSSGTPMAAGSSSRADALISAAGGSNVFADMHSYKTVSYESIASLNPDIILIGTQPELAALQTAAWLEHPLLQGVNAVQQKQVHALDLGKDLNFGPGFAQSLHKVAALFRNASDHPQ